MSSSILIRGRIALPVALAVSTGLVGCTTGSQPASPHAAPGASAGARASVTTTRAVAKPGGHLASVIRIPNGDVLLAGGVVLPNGARTPGATNPSVTQTTIHRTVCRTGYTKTIRPQSSFTTDLKIRQLSSGYAYRGDASARDYEEDHLISLELGGAAADPRNLWPEPYTAVEGARVKDLVENELHDLVCSGRLSLAAAQHDIATNWWRAYQTYGGEGEPRVWDGGYTPSSPSSGGSTASQSGRGPSDATAKCRDGTYSYSQHRSGTCSGHGGVAYWINPPPS